MLSVTIQIEDHLEDFDKHVLALLIMDFLRDISISLDTFR